MLLSVLLTIFSSRIIQVILTLFQLQSVAVPRTIHSSLTNWRDKATVIFVFRWHFPTLIGVYVADDVFQSIPLESSPVQSSPAIVDGPVYYVEGEYRPEVGEICCSSSTLFCTFIGIMIMYIQKFALKVWYDVSLFLHKFNKYSTIKNLHQQKLQLLLLKSHQVRLQTILSCKLHKTWESMHNLFKLTTPIFYW